MTIQQAQIGIIGGSGLYSMPGFDAQREVSIDTPWGAPSEICPWKPLGKTDRVPRPSWRGIRSPSELNFRANIYGMKCWVSSASFAEPVGSLNEEHRPLDFVIPDQSSTARAAASTSSARNGRARQLCDRSVHSSLKCRPGGARVRRHL